MSWSIDEDRQHTLKCKDCGSQTAHNWNKRRETWECSVCGTLNTGKAAHRKPEWGLSGIQKLKVTAQAFYEVFGPFGTFGALILAALALFFLLG